MVKDVFTTYEVAQYCKVTITTVVNWIKDGSLVAYKTKGGHRRIKRADFEEFLHKHNMPVSFQQKILVVDDDYSIQSGLKKLFESEGYEVEVASNGFEAGIMVKDFYPSVVILDLIMPEFDGFAVCELIKKHKELKYIKVIVLTGFPSQENIAKAKKVGADKCFAKPIENNQILEAVSSMIRS
jgi:excisionase family DNA binding protein